MKGRKSNSGLIYLVDLFRKYTIKFMADTDPDANWDFEPVQHQVRVHAGETALMFYRAFNKNDKPVVGMAHLLLTTRVRHVLGLSGGRVTVLLKNSMLLL